eukprot:3632445-Amphidinium_carterae.1
MPSSDRVDLWRKWGEENDDLAPATGSLPLSGTVVSSIATNSSNDVGLHDASMNTSAERVDVSAIASVVDELPDLSGDDINEAIPNENYGSQATQATDISTVDHADGLAAGTAATWPGSGYEMRHAVLNTSKLLQDNHSQTAVANVSVDYVEAQELSALTNGDTTTNAA